MRMYLLIATTLMGAWPYSDCEDDRCALGTTWCEEDQVMLCVVNPVEEFDEEDESIATNLYEILHTLTDGTRTEVREDCREQYKICVEHLDEEGYLCAECDYGLGIPFDE